MKEKILKIIIAGVVVLAFSLMFIKGYENGGDRISESYKGYTKIVALDGLVKSHLTQKAEREYPEYYGGSYIYDDQRHLVVQIVKANIPESEDEEYAIYDKLMHFDDAIIYEYVDNSYNDLEKVATIIQDYFEKVPMQELNVTSIGDFDIMKNIVVVGLSKNTPENRQKFKEQVIDSNLIEFEESNPTIY